MSTTEEDIDALVGRRVRELRLQLGLTQTQLADAIGVTFQQVQKYERGSNRISASKLWLIADRLGVSPSSLVSALPSPTGRSTSELATENDEQGRLLRAFGRITDPQRRQTVIDVAEGLGAAAPRRRLARD
jgi:transcriptional regulator with XRE-family HTH domain